MALTQDFPDYEEALPVATAGISYLRGVTGAGASVRVAIADTFTNYVEPTSMDFNAAARMHMASGSFASPDNSKQPVDWMQKFTQYDSGTDMFAHRPASGREVVVFGSGQTGSTNTDGTWIGFLGNSVMLGANQGTELAPDYDARGNVIGVAGFARSEKPSDGIVCAVWGYASTPDMTSTEFTNHATDFTTTGFETNVDIRHPDPGAKTIVSGKGTTVGWYAFNYQTPGGGVKDMSFGFAANGNPNDDNWSSTNIDNWNGYHVFGLIDKVKTTGLLFGQYFKTNSTGIKFSSLVGSQELAAAIDIGPHKARFGEYTGSTFNNNDFWHNAGALFFRYGGVTNRVLQQSAATITTNAATNVAFIPSGGAQQFNVGYVASAVNYLGVFASATGGAVALVAQGSDTNRDIELRTAGTGLVWLGSAWTSTGDVAINGYMEVKDESGNIRKLATVA